MEYCARITHEGSQTLAEFPDCPGCQTFADAGEDVTVVAAEALEGWLEAHLANGKVPPAPSSSRTGLPVRVNALLAAKLAVRWARNEKGLTQAQVAKLAGVAQQMVAKVENPDYGAGIVVLERVARALGCNLTIELQRIPTTKAPVRALSARRGAKPATAKKPAKRKLAVGLRAEA
jgi:transcriptional regulator with XRE-family HTH domain/predicted RNase H-like HicB family nuclease